MTAPSWLKPVGVLVAVFAVGLLIAGILGVPYRFVRPPEGYDQPRVHLNTKNTTRFFGADPSTVAALVSRAVYPATEPANTPDVVILYDPADWRSGLVASSLLRPLNAVLLPSGPTTEAEIARVRPAGSAALNSTQILTLGSVAMPVGNYTTRRIEADDVRVLLEQAGAHPLHVIVVDPNDPATALLAASWAAFSGDLIVFDEAAAPADLPRYALGDAAARDAKRIAGRTPAETSVRFAAYEDPENPFFGWGLSYQRANHALIGYRSYTLARPDDPATALQAANLARRGKPGPLLWSEERTLPQVVNNYLWTQRPAFWVTPAEGPFHHFWVLGSTTAISFPAQGQADYAVEIGPYRMKGPGMAPMDMLAAVWIALGLASAGWIAFHGGKFLPEQHWTMRLAWPLLALMIGPFGILFYYLAYHRPVIRRSRMTAWDRPLWLQGLVATASAVGFGGLLMVTTGFIMWLIGLPLVPNDAALFWLGSPMVLMEITTYVVAVLVTWFLYQTPMLGMFHGRSYAAALPKALPIVLGSMAAVSLAMFPGMWWLMMWDLPMMPTEESILWFGVMFFTVFLGFLVAWPFNYLFVRAQTKPGLM